MLEEYISNLLEVAGQGDATEESYYHVLKELIEKFARSIGKENVKENVSFL